MSKPPAKPILDWVDRRFPLSALYNDHLKQYYTPKNLNIWYVFGSIGLTVLAIQLVTGIFLVMHYKPDAARAFASVEYIMRDVPWGWLIRYMHSTGASAFFVVMYLHMFRALLYGSYRRPRELVWIVGCTILLALMAEAFLGYLLPWGQMSYWGAQVIVNLFNAIPVIGPDLALLIRGDYVVSDATLSRFFSLHVVLVPLALIALVVAHIMALHQVGSNNPDGIDIDANTDAKGIPLDGIPFQPYYTVHDIFAVSVFLMVFFAVVFFAPNGGGYFLEANNFIEADPLKTPSHIAPVWYFTPFYSMLRATTDLMVDVFCVILAALGVIVLVRRGLGKRTKALAAIALLGAIVLLRMFDAKFWGVVVMGASVLLLFFLPWLDRSPVRSIRYRPGWHKALYAVFVVDFLILGTLGTRAPTAVGTYAAQALTILYFTFFLAMPIWSRLGSFRPLPNRLNFTPH
nr:cytochrome bc complex cytochrome b subunit [Aquabacterium sp.]